MVLSYSQRTMKTLPYVTLGSGLLSRKNAVIFCVVMTSLVLDVDGEAPGLVGQLFVRALVAQGMDVLAVGAAELDHHVSLVGWA